MTLLSAIESHAGILSLTGRGAGGNFILPHGKSICRHRVHLLEGQRMNKRNSPEPSQAVKIDRSTLPSIRVWIQEFFPRNTCRRGARPAGNRGLPKVPPCKASEIQAGGPGPFWEGKNSRYSFRALRLFSPRPCHTVTLPAASLRSQSDIVQSRRTTARFCVNTPCLPSAEQTRFGKQAAVPNVT